MSTLSKTMCLGVFCCENTGNMTVATPFP